MDHLSAWIIFAPIFGALIVWFLPDALARHSHLVAAAISGFIACVGAFALCEFNPSVSDLQSVVDWPWLDSWGVHFYVGLDSENIGLVAMTLILTPLLFLCAPILQPRAEPSEIAMSCGFLLLMESGALGTFLSQDLFLFYVFWELILIPAYLMLGMYGTGERARSGLVFFLYTFVGSLAMLFSILYLMAAQTDLTGVPSSALSDLAEIRMNGKAEVWLFWAIGLAFFVKAPLFPFHGWLRGAYKDAPLMLTIYMAAIMSKMGAYGIGKVLLPLFPNAAMQYAPVLLWASAIGLVYGALLAYNQKDLKSLLACASLSHINALLMGLFSLKAMGHSAALFQMLSHGFLIFGLFLVCGVLQKRDESLAWENLGGLAKFLPMTAISFFVFSLGSMGLPGTNGFVGEFLILLASFDAAPWTGVIAAFGVVLSAAYMLRAYQLSMLGPVSAHGEISEQLGYSVKAIFIMLILFTIGFGIFPQTLLRVVGG